MLYNPGGGVHEPIESQNLRHRFSDDLDLFVNFDSRFREWSERIVDSFWRLGDWSTDVILREEYFVVRRSQSSMRARL